MRCEPRKPCRLKPKHSVQEGRAVVTLRIFFKCLFLYEQKNLHLSSLLTLKCVSEEQLQPANKLCVDNGDLYIVKVNAYSARRQQTMVQSHADLHRKEL